MRLNSTVTDGIIGFSNVPLRLALQAGFVVSGGAFVFGIVALVSKLAGLYHVSGLASLAVVAWVVVTGWIAYLDGIALALIGLTLGAFFLFNFAWSWRTGELEVLLKELRKGSS